jgi:hypothetical protein
MPKQVVEQIPQETEKELTLLRGFRDLMAERVGYAMGKYALSSEMRDATAEQRKASLAAAKFLRENLESFIANGDLEGYKKALEAKAQASEALKKAKAPHMERIKPLGRAVRYIDNVAVPKFLVTLGTEPKPIMTPAEWIFSAIEAEKKARKKTAE